MRTLYKAKLLNDHFLPLTHDPSWYQWEETTEAAIEPAHAETFGHLWARTPRVREDSKIYRCRIAVFENGVGQPDLAMALFSPLPVPANCPLTLYWDSRTTFTATMRPPEVEALPSQSSRNILQEISTLLLHSTRTHVWRHQYPHYLPFLAPDIPLCDMQDWLEMNRGSYVIEEGITNDPDRAPPGFIRSAKLHSVPHIFLRCVERQDEPARLFECQPFPKRRNLTQPATLAGQSMDVTNASRTVRIAVAECNVDRLPWKWARCSLFLPPILQQLHQYMMAVRLQTDILTDIRGLSLDVIAEAITAPCSQWQSNYQRLEFLGDSVLKFAAAFHLFYTHPLWPEGYSSRRKSSLVSNKRLSRAAVCVELGRYIYMHGFLTVRHPVF